jgi:hypothetical protein
MRFIVVLLACAASSLAAALPHNEAQARDLIDIDLCLRIGPIIGINCPTTTTTTVAGPTSTTIVTPTPTPSGSAGTCRCPKDGNNDDGNLNYTDKSTHTYQCAYPGGSCVYYEVR